MRLTLMSVILFCLSCSFAQAQSPNKMSFQAVIRDSTGGLVANQSVGLRMSILQGSVSGSSVFTETHSPTTNSSGLISIEIGGGTTTDDFSSIDWSNGPYYLKREVDPAGGTNYTISGTSQFLSVPYAMYATIADTVLNAPDTSNVNEKISVLGISGDSLSITEGGMTMKVSVDSSNVNEIQSLSEVLSRDSLANQRIKNVVDPVDAQDAATKAYIDDLLISFGISLGSAGIEGLLTSGYSVSDLLSAGVSVSDLFSTGSPLTLHTGGVPIDSLYGKTYAGGLIFYLDTLNTYSFEGLVAAILDQSTSIAWINAVQVCLDYMIMEGSVTYDDWFLPSKDELHEMYKNLKSIGFGVDGRLYYWSSTETVNNSAWAQHFGDGYQWAFNKLTVNRVRAVRAF